MIDYWFSRYHPYNSSSQKKWVEHHLAVSLNGGTPKTPPKWSFLLGKPMVAGYHHFRKHPFVSLIFHHLQLPIHPESPKLWSSSATYHRRTGPLGGPRGPAWWCYGLTGRSSTVPGGLAQGVHCVNQTLCFGQITSDNSTNIFQRVLFEP